VYTDASTCASVGVESMVHISCTAMTNAVTQDENNDLALAREVGEAANFATYFTGSPAAESTPHLYISALATWSQDTSLCRNWKKQFSRIPVFAHTKGSVDLPLMTIPAKGQILAVAFSRDGTRIVSGSYDNSVRVWDASTGAELNTLKGHTNSVNSVAFSRDSTRIVSGSDDESVRVWDVSTGVELNMLKGHTGWVNSVAFSRDGTRIVSGSDDESVRVWDVSTGAELNMLKGLVNSVAFSRDRTRVTSSLDEPVGPPTIGYKPFVWALAETNWIISSQGQDHLMWVPQEVQVNQLSHNILTISRHGFGSVDFQQSMIGVEWVGCYTPQFKDT